MLSFAFYGKWFPYFLASLSASPLWDGVANTAHISPEKAVLVYTYFQKGNISSGLLLIWVLMHTNIFGFWTQLPIVDLGVLLFVEGTAQIFYSAICLWDWAVARRTENQSKCRQLQEAYKSSHWQQLCGIGSTSSSGPPIDLWKTNLHELNLNRSLATIYFSRLHSCCKLDLKEGFLIP